MSLPDWSPVCHQRVYSTHLTAKTCSFPLVSRGTPRCMSGWLKERWSSRTGCNRVALQMSLRWSVHIPRCGGHICIIRAELIEFKWESLKRVWHVSQHSNQTALVESLLSAKWNWETLLEVWSRHTSSPGSHTARTGVFTSTRAFLATTRRRSLHVHSSKDRNDPATTAKAAPNGSYHDHGTNVFGSSTAENEIRIPSVVWWTDTEAKCN